MLIYCYFFVHFLCIYCVADNLNTKKTMPILQMATWANITPKLNLFYDNRLSSRRFLKISLYEFTALLSPPFFNLRISSS